VGKYGGIIPVEASFQHNIVIDDAILGMNGRVRDREVVKTVAERDRGARLLQSRNARQQRPPELLVHGILLARTALPGKMAVEDDPDVDATPLGVNEGVDHAVLILTAQFADQEQNQLDRMLGAVDFGNDGVMRAIVLPAQRGVTPECVQQIETIYRHVWSERAARWQMRRTDQRMLPLAHRVVALTQAANPFSKPFLEQIEAGGSATGIVIDNKTISSIEDLESAFADMGKERPDAVIVQPSLPNKRAADLAVTYRIPAVSTFQPFAQQGGLMSYAPAMPYLYRRAAAYVDKILTGAKPGDLSVEQPTQFELIINMKTAKALALTVPPSLLARADEVIE
jgi:hypothetical protein